MSWSSCGMAGLNSLLFHAGFFFLITLCSIGPPSWSRTLQVWRCLTMSLLLMSFLGLIPSCSIFGEKGLEPSHLIGLNVCRHSLDVLDVHCVRNFIQHWRLLCRRHLQNVGWLFTIRVQGVEYQGTDSSWRLFFATKDRSFTLSLSGFSRTRTRMTESGNDSNLLKSKSSAESHRSGQRLCFAFLLFWFLSFVGSNTQFLLLLCAFYFASFNLF